MNKELFVSSTPHETKVGLVEDDLLAEVYLERENEYTLAGSIYKGRVTRVLPGMQSAFVDIGLERDAFLYVSDFMELEEHDEDLTDSIPANRGVQDLRATQESNAMPEGGMPHSESDGVSAGGNEPVFEQASDGAGHDSVTAPYAPPTVIQDSSNGGERDRSYRGRRRRRGGRRDGRDRGAEPRTARSPVEPSTPVVPNSVPRLPESGRTQFGPPPGYQPIILPGESISKYRGLTPQPATLETRPPENVPGTPVTSAPDTTIPVASAFPDDEPIFATADPGANAIATVNILPAVEASKEEINEAGTRQSYAAASASAASASVDWRGEIRRPQAVPSSVPSDAIGIVEDDAVIDDDVVEEEREVVAHSAPSPEPLHVEAESPVFAAPGTLEEETIDEEEADTVRYEQSSDEGYEEFEEETRAAGQGDSAGRRALSDVRETVDEIHMSSLAESGAQPAEGAVAETDDDSEELELEEAQAEAEALLDAEAGGVSTDDTRAEVRAPSGTAGYTQRAPRYRPSYDRRGGGRRGGGRRFPRRGTREIPKISDLLKEGQEILVQIAKEPIGKKGARITSHIALPGRFLVYMPTVNHTGVSRKISSDEERQRLKRIVMSERENGHGGFIVRTAAQNASEDELRADIRFLKGLWNDIKTRAEASKPPALIYHDLNVVERVLRDQVTSDFSVIWVDTEPEYERVLRFFNRFQPGLVKRVKLYTKETPLFEQFGLAEEMNKALKSKVWLKSGGYIVINQTEALVAIDINTGKYVGKTSRLEDTIVKTNVDAIKEIVRQIRLRDLGGIIIIDFIDMDERRNRQRVMQALEEELRHDRAPSKVLQFNDFGLVAITRKRVKQSLERTIGAPCPYCQSTGYVKSLTTIANEIYVEMRKIAKHLEHEDVMLRVNPDVAKELKANNGRLLNEMEELTKRTIIVKSDPALHQEQFDIN
jgi:Rne/Rng family ribonuclease